MPGPKPRTIEQAYKLLLSEAVRIDTCLVLPARCRKQAGHVRISVMGKSQTAHRVVWQFHNRILLPKEVIMHKCDNPACINIDHLILGTHRENILDMWDKSRGVLGEDHGNSILTESDVRFIKLNPQISGVQLGKKFNCSPNTIYAIRKGRSWNHIDVDK